MLRRSEHRAYGPGKNEARQGIAYLIVGVSTAILEFALFVLLYLFLGISVPIANILAVIVATVTNFALNRNITFNSTSRPLVAFLKYMAVFIMNTIISTAVVSLADYMGFIPAVAKAIIMCCTVCWNFVLYKKVVFV